MAFEHVPNRQPDDALARRSSRVIQQQFGVAVAPLTRPDRRACLQRGCTLARELKTELAGRTRLAAKWFVARARHAAAIFFIMFATECRLLC